MMVARLLLAFTPKSGTTREEVWLDGNRYPTGLCPRELPRSQGGPERDSRLAQAVWERDSERIELERFKRQPVSRRAEGWKLTLFSFHLRLLLMQGHTASHSPGKS